MRMWIGLAIASCLTWALLLLTTTSTPTCAFVVPISSAHTRKRQLPPSTSLTSLSPPSQQQEPLLTTTNQRIKDALTVVVYGVSCVVLAFTVSLYQDYDCSHLKPLGVLRPQALYGMAQQGKGEISSYNTVMQHHRDYRVKMWHVNIMENDKTEAVSTLIAALDATQQLKIMAQDYQWKEMQDLIRQPVLTTELEEACSVLRKSATTAEAREEIGFDWGSCAWRHCGAQADAQESLAELYNLIGVLEPFECQFCLDIVERSIRDILAVAPKVAEQKVPPYVPYVARGIEGGESGLDMDFMEALEGLRSNLVD